jgi:glycosyltransferase involved in cell wall biosynthesis
MSALPEVSVVLPTYNRANELERAVASALNQTVPAETYELIVVNNNSTDGTSELLDRLTRQHPGRVRAVLEPKQGVSCARNAGIAASRAPILAFFDDDVRVAPDWIESIQRAFREHPDIDCVGGRVLPDWPSAPPAWLTRAHWAPLALQDFGAEPMLVSAANPKGLISANLACRRSVLQRVGGFSPRFQRVKDGIGSLEDDEWMRRLWQAGGRGLYVPQLVTYTAVPDDRLTREYHRRWHRGHGRFYALLHAAEIEHSTVGSLFGVPAHLYRSALAEAGAWLSDVLRGRRDHAFSHEVKLRFFRGFFGQRVTERFYP